MSSNIRITILSSKFLNLNTKKYIISFSEDILSADIDNCSISYNSSEIEGGGISIISSGKINIKSVFFNSTRIKAALKIESNELNEEINIVNCTFNSCLGSDLCIGLNFVCYGIEFMTRSFSFENNTIIGLNIIESNFYIGIINCKNKFNLKMINDRFINNTCSSLYGGGSGLYFKNLAKLQLLNCTFNGNKAKQNTKVSRPIESLDYFYNGDGGGIQLGFICSESEYDVIFDKCIFENNKAQRHGGAIALQTQASVQIINCKFIENIANFKILNQHHRYYYLKIILTLNLVEKQVQFILILLFILKGMIPTQLFKYKKIHLLIIIIKQKLDLMVQLFLQNIMEFLNMIILM